MRLINDEMREDEQLLERPLGILTPEVTNPFKSGKKKRSQYVALSAPSRKWRLRLPRTAMNSPVTLSFQSPSTWFCI
jgi:hypothetical protein